MSHILLNLTDNCNLKCRYCFTHQHPRDMTLDIAKQAILWLWNNKNPSKEKIHVTFFGGEPMLKYEEIIKPLVEWINNQSTILVEWGMTTNGTLFTEERLKWLYDNNVPFLLSIDGNKTTQDYNRPCKDNTSSFDKIKPYISSILKYFPKVTFRSTAIPETIEYIVDNYLFAREQGFQDFYIMPDVTQPWTQEDIDKYNSQVGLIYEIFYRDISMSIHPLKIHNIIKTYENYFAKKSFPSLQDCYRCGLGTTSLGIGTDGSIWGCQEHATYLNDLNDIFYIGDIFQGIIPEKHIKLLEAYHQTPYQCEQKNMCINCIRKKWCKKLGCPSHNFLNFHNINQQDKLSCLYKIFEDMMALELLSRAEQESNQLYYQYVLNAITTGGE